MATTGVGGLVYARTLIDLSSGGAVDLKDLSGITKVPHQADLAADAGTTEIVTAFNALLKALVDAGIMEQLIP